MSSIVENLNQSNCDEAGDLNFHTMECVGDPGKEKPMLIIRAHDELPAPVTTAITKVWIVRNRQPSGALLQMYMMAVPAATPEVSIQDKSSSEYSSLEARINDIGSMGLIEKPVFSTKVTQQLTAIQLLDYYGII